jgi:hypothetical protein
LAVDPVTGFAREYKCLVLCEVALEPSNERQPARAGCRPEGLPYRCAGLERLRGRCDEIFACTFTLTIDSIPDRDVGAHECVSRRSGDGGSVTGF